jgi:GAF domain-containing protein
MNVRDSIRKRYSALSKPAVAVSKRSPSKDRHFGHKHAAERVKNYSLKQQIARDTERQKLALENGALKDEINHLRIKLVNSIAEGSIIKSKYRGIDRKFRLSSSSSTRYKSHNRSPHNPESTESLKRPSTTSGARDKNQSVSSPFRPLTAPNKRILASPNAKRTSVSSRLVATPNNQYRDFTRRIDRLQHRVTSLEKQLSEEKTKSRLTNLRQRTTNSAYYSNNQAATSIKHGMEPSFWEHLRKDETQMVQLTGRSNKSENTEEESDNREEEYVASFHADKVLLELVSQKLLEASLHMEHDVRKEWSGQLKLNVERLCGISNGYKSIFSSIRKIMKSAPFNSVNTASLIATEISTLFGAQIVRIFNLSKMENYEATDKSIGSSFTFVPIANKETATMKNRGTKLTKSEKQIIEIQGLTFEEVADRMTLLVNDNGGREGAQLTKSGYSFDNDNDKSKVVDEKESDEIENVLMKNSKGMGFVAGTFLQGKIIQANGDLWQHECFNMSTDGTWIEPGNQCSLLSVPVRYQQDESSSLSVIDKDSRTNSIPFAIIQLLRFTKNKSKDALEEFDDDSLALLKPFLEVLGPALYSCSRPMTKSAIITPLPEKVKVNEHELAFKTKQTDSHLRLRSNSRARSKSDLSRYDSKYKSRPISPMESRKTTANLGVDSDYRSHQRSTAVSLDTNVLAEVTSRRIKCAAESAGINGDVSHVNGPGMVSFLHAVTAVIHCALSADRTCLYLSQDMFGGIRVYHDDDIMFAPVSRAMTPLSLSSRLAIIKEGMGNPDDDDSIINFLQQSIQWDSLDGTGKKSGMNDGLSLNDPFHVHEDMNDDNSQVHHQTQQTRHHYHKPSSVLRKRTDLAAYVASNQEVIRMTGAYDEPVTKFAVDNANDYITDSILVVPIILNDEPVGVIELFNKHELSGGNEMLSDEGFNKNDELLLIHFASVLSAALSSVERQGRAERISETFCKLYHRVGLATGGNDKANLNPRPREPITENNLTGAQISSFGNQLLEVEAVIRQLLVAEYVFIWVSDHTVGGLRTYFQQRKSSDMLLDVHYSQKQLLGSALGAAYFKKKCLNYQDLNDVRAKNVARQESNKLFKAQIDIPGHVQLAQSMVCVPLIYSGSNSSDPVGVLQIINLDTRELAIRCMLHLKSRVTQFSQQIAAQTATVIGCLLRMDHFARVQHQTHELLGTFSELHHSSSLKPLDLIRSSIHAVEAIFKTSNRKVTRALLILRDQNGNFVWARRKYDSLGSDGHYASGTGAFDDMFHTFDAEKNRKKSSLNDATSSNQLHGRRRPSQSLNHMVQDNYEIDVFSSKINSFAAYIVQERRPVVVTNGIEDITLETVRGRTTKIPKEFKTTETDKQMGIDVGSTLGCCVPVSQQDGLHIHDIHCVLLLQRDENTNLKFSSEDRDLAGLVVAHLCAAIASVLNTTDQLRRERALGDLLTSTNSKENSLLLTMELDKNGKLVDHNGLLFQPKGIGFISKTLLINNVKDNTGSSGGNEKTKDNNKFGASRLNRINLNLAPNSKELDQLTSSPFDQWLCESVQKVIQQVLDAAEDGKPPAQTWISKVVELPAGPSNENQETKNTNSTKMKPITSFQRTSSFRGKLHISTVVKEDGKDLSPNDMFQLLTTLTKDYMKRYCHFNDDGESSLLGLCTACDDQKRGLLNLRTFSKILKFSINTNLKMEDIENLATCLDSLVHENSRVHENIDNIYTEKQVHYVKFVRAMVPPIVTVRRAQLTVIPTFSASSTSHSVDGMHLRFIFVPTFDPIHSFHL